MSNIVFAHFTHTPQVYAINDLLTKLVNYDALTDAEVCAHKPLKTPMYNATIECIQYTVLRHSKALVQE